MNSLTTDIIQLENEHLVQTYKRPPFVITRGQGVMLYDAEGNEYLDMVAGIAVNALGYSDPGMIQAIQEAATGLLHTSSLYYTEPQARLAAAICAKSFADRVFFTNSGTEANEGALKFIRKYHYDAGDSERKEIICFTGAFHGRTLGSLSLTPKEKYQKPFAPLMPGVIVAQYNDIASAEAAISHKTAAVIVEPVQGEGGINPATPEFLQALRRLCDERGALLWFDQVQCGVGRTGTLWSSDPSGVTPDLQTLAKALGGGLPIGAVLTTNNVADHIHPGDHGSTYAGSPFITKVAHYVFDRISQAAFLDHVCEVGGYLKERLQEINSPLVKEVRGRGLMVGMEMTVDVGQVVEQGYQNGLMLVNAGTNVVRFVPPLILEKQHIDVMIERLTGILVNMGDKSQ
jgi:acetylornithine/N-succinyldiaminopimelate aminotransferase